MNVFDTLRWRWGALVAVTLLAGCGEAMPTTASPAAVSASPRPASTGALAIAAPRDGATTGADVTVRFELVGATLADLTVTDVRPDTGHLHVTVDGELVSMTGGLTQTLGSLAAGDHLLKAELVAADHAPFSPRVIAAVAFTVTP